MLNLDKFNPNLKQWRRRELLLFFVIVPAVVTAIYLLPQPVKNTMILSPSNSNPFSWFMSNYVHTAVWHFTANLGSYFIIMFVLFSINTNKKVFRWSTTLVFLVLPFIASLFVVTYMPQATSQGFSAIDAGLAGYTVYAVCSFMKLRVFKDTEIDFAYLLVIGNIFFWSLMGGHWDFFYPLTAVVAILLFKNQRVIASLIRHVIRYNNPFSKKSVWHIPFNVYWLSVSLIAAVILFSGYDLLSTTAPQQGVNILAHYVGYVFGVLVPAMMVIWDSFILWALRNR